MNPFRKSSSVSLGRRRGTTSSGGILSSRALFLLAALCASVRAKFTKKNTLFQDFILSSP